MGAKFSAEADDTQILIRDKNGQLILHTGKMDTATSCSTLPIPLNSQEIQQKEQKVQYLFFPSSNYQGKNFHLHTFFDYDCDTPANDVVSPERTALNKNLNHIQQSRNSNSEFFEFNQDPINMPVYPKFLRQENGALMSRYTKRSAYSNCREIPFPPVKDSTVKVKHNGVPLKVYTDITCENEYINILSDPKSITDHYNVDNRIAPINDDDHRLKPTNIKSYIEPAVKTNALYYRTFRDQYP